MTTASTASETSRFIGGIPEAWPALLSREQVCAYVGMSPDSFARVCGVAPVALGVKLLRWRRADIDEWVAGLPSRLLRGAASARDDAAITPTQPAKVAGEERRLGALERANQRAHRRQGTRACRKN